MYTMLAIKLTQIIFFKQINQFKRHLDAGAVNEFWAYLDDFMRLRKKLLFDGMLMASQMVAQAAKALEKRERQEKHALVGGSGVGSKSQSGSGHSGHGHHNHRTSSSGSGSGSVVQHKPSLMAVEDIPVSG